MIDLQLIDPKEIFTDLWFEEYQRQKETIGYELAKLNACLLVLSKIDMFPFHIFAPYREKSHFWELTSVCFFESAVLAIWKVCIDFGKEGLTLQQFKNAIFKNLQDEKVRPPLRDALRNVNFEVKLSQLKGKVEDFRHNIVAHWNQSWLRADDEFKRMHAIDLRDLQAMAEILNQLFQLLCFESDFATLPRDYYFHKLIPNFGTDIDELLADIVLKSHVLHHPERHPEVWQELKAELSTQDIDIFNSYRKRFGLTPA